MRKFLAATIAAAAMLMCCASIASAGRTHEDIVRQADEEMKKICTSMQQYMQRPDNVKKLMLIDEPVINAYADDKGTVAIYMGMVDFVQSADELAMVCGHELTHLSAQHIKRSLGNSILSAVVATAIGGTAGDVAGQLLQSKQSRKHEREADQIGLIYAWNAGFNPYTAPELWEGMSLLSGNSALEKYLSGHPVSKERVENFRVLLYRNCKDGTETTYCDEILNDQQLKTIFEEFETRK